MRILGRPSEPTVWEVPSKSTPVTVGALKPRAGSEAGSARKGSVFPSTVTSANATDGSRVLPTIEIAIHTMRANPTKPPRTQTKVLRVVLSWARLVRLGAACLATASIGGVEKQQDDDDNKRDAGHKRDADEAKSLHIAG